MSTEHVMQRHPAFLALLALVFLLGSAAGGVLGGYMVLNRYQPSPAVQLPAVVQEDALPPASVRAARAEEDVTISVVKRSAPAVVSIVITREVARSTQQPFDFFGIEPQPPVETGPKVKQQVGAGTGFIVTSDGLIVTNRHVVNDKNATYTVVTNSGTKYEAKVLAIDPVVDVAVVKIEAQDLPTLQFGDSDQIQIGETVLAIGNALSEFHNSVTKGVISGLNRRVIAGGAGNGSEEVIEEALQTDAAINPGNSGGPLLDLSGKVIGINTATDRSGQLIGFAIPSNVIKRIVDSVRLHGRIVRPYLGIRYTLLSQRPDLAQVVGMNQGAFILGDSVHSGVVPNSPAAKAGLKDRDIVLAINGQPVSLEHSLSSLLAKHQPKDTIELTIRREGKEMTLKVQLEDFDEANKQKQTTEKK